MSKVVKEKQLKIQGFQLNKTWITKSVDTNPSSPTKIVVISRAQGNKIGMGLSNQTTFCGEKKTSPPAS